MQEAPHIGNILRQYVNKHRIFQSAWARKEGLQPTTIVRYLKQPSMRIDTLFGICLTLKHNFIREIADMLPAELEPQALPNRDAEVEALQQQVKELQQEVATLEKALKLVGRG